MGAVAYLLCFLLRPSNPFVYVAFAAVATVSMGYFNTVVWAMITDVIDDTEVRTGVREDGTVYSVYSFARKLGQAISSGLIGALLTMIGYCLRPRRHRQDLQSVLSCTLCRLCGTGTDPCFPLSAEQDPRGTEHRYAGCTP